MSDTKDLIITSSKDGDSLVLTLSGRLDTIQAPKLEAELKTALNGVKELTFEMKDLEYISSAGLRVILSTQKVMSRQGEFILTNVNSDIMEVFSITGFDDILTIKN